MTKLITESEANMSKKAPTSMRLPDMTAKQLAELIAQTGMTQSEVITTAIDRMYREETMKTIKLGKINDTYTFAVKIDGRYVKMSNQDANYERPDARIYYDSGIYPGIADVDQYMCNQANGR
jgi:predicted DNA-binding protein